VEAAVSVTMGRANTTAWNVEEKACVDMVERGSLVRNFRPNKKVKNAKDQRSAFTEVKGHNVRKFV
jgi:hypothetical protein